ncbi:unnamed protein product, partial [Prorocentrum cordatum]
AAMKNIFEICDRCHFDRAENKWAFYVEQGRPNQRQRIDMEAAVEFIAGPILSLLTRRRWQPGALSRWTGVISCLERMVLGAVLGNILPLSLAGLSARMEVTEAKVKEYLAKAAAQLLMGEESADHIRAREGGRVLKVPAFFQDPHRPWQLGIILIVVSVLDRFGWRVIGAPSRGVQKLGLGELVDPGRSALADTVEVLTNLVENFKIHDGGWKLLSWLGAERADRSIVMTYARVQVLGANIRFSTAPVECERK